MKWKKLGKIFDPTEHVLPNGCREFAQSPQALVFDDFVRIYFSTRQVDKTGKYLSHPAFVEMAKDFSKVLRVSDKTVLDLGGLGSFDEHGIFPLNVFKHEGRVFGYISGWSRRVSVSVETAIGLSESHDGGLTFERIGAGPILAASLDEPFLVGDPFVAFHAGQYHMWYIYGTQWADYDHDQGAQRVYKIGHAVSGNGINWQKEGRQLIADVLGPDECQALPTVIKLSGRYHMYFCYRQAADFRKNRDRGYRLGYAYSDDLASWTRDDGKAGIDVSATGWDSDMMCYPHLFESGGQVYILYNGNEFGKYGFGLAILENED
ncbi:hypothetical protein HGA34_02235 [Candidatus Falkowbacteria bacterium]|nr:hypothetical protein [Candidatus Falkowbacteria bacterium]